MTATLPVSSRVNMSYDWTFSGPIMNAELHGSVARAIRRCFVHELEKVRPLLENAHTV
jgi:hypothetical protein